MKNYILLAAFCFPATAAYAQPYIHAECGTEFTIALRGDSTLWACGNNGNGQLGVDSSISESDTLLPVQPGNKWIYAATGAIHTMAIASDSTLWGWGLNYYGQLGIGDTSEYQVPTQVNTTQHWRYVSAGEFHTIAILDDGTLWGAGTNTYGQLGTGDTTQQTFFVQIGTSNNWKTVSTGGVFTMGIKNDGTLWGWGYNGDGELGLGTTADTFMSPTQVGTGTNWVMVSCGFEFALAMKSDGTIWSAGFNGNGQLGTPTATTSDSSFTQIGTETDWKFIAAGSSYGFGIKENGTLWGWGFNSYGQLGVTPVSAAEPVKQAGTDSSWQYVSGADGAFVPGSGVFGFHSAGFKTKANVLCTTGANYAGQLGNGEIIALPSYQLLFQCNAGETPSGVSNVLSSNNVNVYPNPVFDILNIDGIETSAVYQIQNMLGASVQKGNLHTGNNNFSIQSLIPGVYIISVNTEEGKRYNVRLVKE